MSSINREWHESHPTPKNATELQRIAWLIDHARNRGCHGIANGVARLFENHGVPVPAPYSTPTQTTDR